MQPHMPSHELYLLHLGQLGVRDETGAAHFGPVPGYLIRAASGRTILVDSGNPAALIGAENSEPWWPLLADVRPEDDIVPRLAELGIAPAGVDLLISTHFDFDHCGRHDAFAAAGITSLVQAAHLAQARGNPRFDPALWDLPGIRYETVAGDVELEPGLRLLLSSGHVIGHQSLFIETSSGPVLLAIDAIPHKMDITTDANLDTSVDPVAAKASRDKLADLAFATGASLLCGHDGRQWATLPKSPRPFARP
jgi:N-acyl homoserine lactone hydrolase